jgi:hypothetical protein
MIALPDAGPPPTDASLAPSPDASTPDSCPAHESPLVAENARAGDPSWVLTATASGEIEAFATDTSVDRGGSLQVLYSTLAATVSLSVFRLGWYGGTGARRVLGPHLYPGVQQPPPRLDPGTYLVECAWSHGITIETTRAPGEWLSGIYLAQLTALPSGKQTYAVFVVRDDARGAALLFQSSVFTYAAYNTWGGHSLYGPTGAQAVKVSLDRPYLYSPSYGSGAGQVFRWELNALRFLEREGYDVSYSTDSDLHRDPSLLEGHQALLSVGHDEYWSWPMRTQAERARARGVHLAFLGANASYWQIRLEPSGAGVPDRTIVCYKGHDDPLQAFPALRHLSTTRWRDAPVSRPEAALIGVMYVPGYWPLDADLVLTASPSWVFAGTHAVAGEALPHLVGYEADALAPSSPAGVEVLANSPVIAQGGAHGHSNMTVYTASSGAIVFATGSMQWSWGLDAFVDDLEPRPSRVHPAAQQMMRNVLARFTACIR